MVRTGHMSDMTQERYNRITYFIIIITTIATTIIIIIIIIVILPLEKLFFVKIDYHVCRFTKKS